MRLRSCCSIASLPDAWVSRQPSGRESSPGRSSRPALKRSCTSSLRSHLNLIDPWQHRSEQGYEHARFARRDDSQMELIYRGVRERFGREIACGQVVIHRHPSAVAVAALPPLDWVYIDGDHTYEGVAADLRSCWARLTPNGRVAGDDYGVRGWWDDGVTKAVDEFARSVDCKKTIIGTQFLLRKVSPRDDAGRRRKRRGRA